jgi:hypothetical protein
MEEYKIVNDNGTTIKWSSINNNDYYCLLYQDNNQKYTFTPSTDLNCELFMIGGGGAGGYFFGGGGGAGAAYINKNYTFSKDNTYTFTIGSGGTCTIDNISNLFNNGLVLKVFNVTQQTSPKLNNFEFSNDDYSSINVPAYTTSSTYIVNTVNLNADLLHTNTLYVWDGYIKSSVSGNINFQIESDLKTFVWIDKYIFNDTNTFISSYNIKDIKTIEMKEGIFYKIKIIVYADANINTKKFNLKCDNCTFYNFNSANEIYNYKKATETLISVRDKNNTIVNNLRCIGGGNGGCGLINQNTDLDGGCGGGSGLNKINGKSLAQPSYNGFDGAIGTYLGGGGGISGKAIDNTGGDGVVLPWFNQNFIFGAGGNGAGNTSQRKLGYGSGGDGLKCCYSTKTTNNNGMNGCVLIYIKSPVTIEKFTNLDSVCTIPSESIARTLQDASITSLYNYTLVNNNIKSSLKNSTTFPFFGLSSNFNGKPANHTTLVQDNLLQEMYLYDLFTITNIYASAYNLFYDKINIIDSSTNSSEEERKFENVTITIPTVENSDTKCREDAGKIYLDLGFLNSPNYNSNMNTYLTSVVGTAAGDSSKTIAATNNNYISNTDVYQKLWQNSTAANRVINISAGAQTGLGANNLFTNFGNITAATQRAKKTDYAFPLYFNVNNSTNRIENVTGITNFFNYVCTTDATLIKSGGQFVKPCDYIKIGFSNLPGGGSSSNVTGATNPTYFRSSGYVGAGVTYGNTFVGYNDITNITNNDILAAYNRDLAAYVTNKPASVLNDYTIQRVFLYHKALYDITNFKNTVGLLQNLKYNVYFNNLLFHTNIIHYNLFNYSFNGSKSISGGVTSTTIDNTVFNNDITKIKNILDIYSTTLVDSSDISNTIDNLTNISDVISIDKETYYTTQGDLNKAINTYNMYLSTYNTVLLNFKIFMGIIILLIVSIIAIYMTSDNYIDLNSKISIYTITIIFVIIATYLYYTYEVVERFADLYSTYTGVASYQGAFSFDTQNVLLPLIRYIQTANNFITKVLSNASTNNVNGVTNEIQAHVNNYIADRRSKKDTYNKKFNSLKSSTELLIKNINFYKSIMMLISFIMVLLLLTIILYLLFPQFAMVILVAVLIPLIISVGITVYYLSRSTRSRENKKYWANMNPTETVLKKLD